MRILIVDDNQALAEITAELLRCVDGPARDIEAISLAGNLQSAVRLLPQHDLVLCDGEFPTAPDSPFPEEQWAAVFREACRYGADFILYSGSPVCLEDARYCGIAAIAKPATIDKIYAELTARCARRSQLQPLYASGREPVAQRGGQI